MIKAVFFDAAQTLIHIPKGVAHHYREVALRHGLELNESRLKDAFRLVWSAMPARLATSAARPDDDRGWWRELVARVLHQCGAKTRPKVFNAYFDELYAHFAKPGVWELYPDVRSTLTQLRGTYRLGIISNFDRRLYSILRTLSIAEYFDAVVLSSETGADKPDPRIFQIALARVNAQPDEALHVGDDPVHDWQGAANAGMQIFQLNRPKNSPLDVLDFVNSTKPHGS
jgi:putative hydrolase of the HAD superfamily